MDRLFQVLGFQVDWRFTLVVASLIFLRMMMITATIPFLTGRPAPTPVKIGLALSLLVFLYPFLSPEVPDLSKASPFFLMLLYLKEALYGIAIGFGGSIIFHGFQAAGLVVDNQRGASHARLFNPQFGQESSIFGQFYFLLGVVLFLGLGGHLLFLKTVVLSYELLPLAALPPSAPDVIGLIDEFVKLTGSVLILSIQLTAPVLIAVFLADFIFGTISRTAPAINVFEMSFGIRAVLGVIIVFLSIGLVADEMGKLSRGMIGQVEGIIRYLARP